MSGLMHLFQRLVNTNDCHSDDINKLHMAAKEGNDMVIQDLISSRLDVDCRYNTSDVTALYLAAANCHNSTIKLLLDRGANVEAEVETEVGTLHLLCYAVYRNDTIAVKNLIDNGADVNSIGGRINIKDGHSAVHRERLLAEMDKKYDISHIYFDGNYTNFSMRKKFSYLALKPLSIAAYCCSEEMVELLVNHKSSIDGAKGEISPLVIAIVKRCEEVVMKLLKLGASTNTTVVGGHLLHWAVSQNMVEVVKNLSNGDLLNDRDEVGRTPLNIALNEFRFNWRDVPRADKPYADILKVLLSHGADINAGDNQGFTPLHMVISPEIAKVLLERRADVNAQIKYGETPLHISIKNFNVNIVKLLLFYNASMDITCHDIEASAENFKIYQKFKQIVTHKRNWNNSIPISGFTPMTLAAGLGNKEILSLLVEKNKSTLNPENYVWPPIHLLVYVWPHWWGVDELAKLKFLINSGANVNIKDAYSLTPLHKAIMIGNTKSVSALLDLKADVNASDINGWTPFHAAVYNQDINIAQMLRKAGSDINMADKSGFTSLMWSLIGNRIYFFKLMIEKTLDLTSTNRYHYYRKMCGLPRHRIDYMLSQINKTGQPESILDLVYVDNDRTSFVVTYVHVDFDNFHEKFLVSTNKHINTVTWIIENTGNMDMQDKKMGWTALHWASASGDFDVVKLLVERGAYLNLKSLLGHTPMFLARYWGQKGIYEYLKQQGAVW